MTPTQTSDEKGRHTVDGVSYPSYMIEKISYDLVKKEGSKLFGDHWKEVALNKKLMVLKPDYKVYEALDKSGKLLVVGAFHKDKLVGYSVNFITNHLHYSDLVVCSNDILFLEKEYRNAGMGIDLIKQTEVEAKEKGAKLMLWHVKKGTALDKLMLAKKYIIQDIVYSKEI